MCFDRPLVPDRMRWTTRDRGEEPGVCGIRVERRADVRALSRGDKHINHFVITVKYQSSVTDS